MTSGAPRTLTGTLIDYWPVEERLEVDGVPLTMADAVDRETGRLHPAVLAKLSVAHEIRLGVDAVRVVRWMTREELADLADREASRLAQELKR